MSATGTLTFTTSNWNVAQTVTVTAGDDPDAADDTATLTHTANGGDYVDVTTELHVIVDDDETASIVLSKNSLEPVENATGTTYTVRLSHVPTVTVTITIEGHDRHRPDPVHDHSDLRRTPTGTTPRTVTVTAAHDADAVNDPAILTHTANGGAYQRPDEGR